MAAEPAFDEAIHAPSRLRLCGLLRPVEDAEFSALRATLDMSEANLSKTVKALVELGYAQVKKESSASRSDRRRTTSVSLTARGKRAFDGHVAALQRLAAGVVV
ncbi:transcriptional regulator [Amnibacterium setariae]|uniref:Transcriptional regulator n=1 Tax=Amnibacterium setariae TaxID=2306585 RepID=A0A3A1U3F2_9MICO|nr:transcriptional regulator [Amnibacterium setariae]RIX31071.1 transcriptional regulator [Amnibacterium setariae]